MTKQLCDLCGVDVTGKKSGAVGGVPDADDRGDGTEEHHFDLCTACYRAWLKWMKAPKR